ncbi:QRFP-like peptide receptor [Mytilus edulis]|uniref:QRFP-like peptide receptor n=1 Tax=Mytilus edulis TaxID=6550 RepID=UPI0039F1426F
MESNYSLRNICVTENTSTENFQVRYGRAGRSLQTVIIFWIISLFGIIGNGITLIVLFKRKLWTSVNILIMIMSVSDSLARPFITSTQTQKFLGKDINWLTTLVRDIFTTSSCISAMIIGMERSFAIRNPFKFKETWKINLTVKLYVVIQVMMVIIVIVKHVYTEVDDPFYDKYLYVPYYILIRGIPFSVILVTNILLVCGLVKNNQILSKMTNEKLERERMRQEVAITRMVMTVTSVYFVCMVPGRLLAGVIKAGLLRDERQYIYLIVTYLELSNFSVNTIIYTMTSSFFREGYRELIVSCFCRRCRQGSSESPIEKST